MEFKEWNGFCLCSLGGRMPADAQTVEAPFAPLVLLVDGAPKNSRGLFAVKDLDEVWDSEGIAALLPTTRRTSEPLLREFVERNGAAVLNTAFQNAFSFLCAPKKKDGLRVTLVGLGDVGGTLLTALKLIGAPLSEISIFDPNEALCRRYELELNQVLYRSTPRVRICPPDELFDCDLFLFTASRGVPPPDSAVADVRMAQFAANRKLVAHYAKKAREASFGGLFCQISDPVDPLSRVAFLESNRDENGTFDAAGLLPEQVCGFGLGVMAARAAYYAEKMGLDFGRGRVYGPHGAELIVANDPLHYDDALSRRLTCATVEANLRVRELGFKPYIAPALSSAALSILRMIEGEEFCGAIPLGRAYFGCRCRMTPFGVQTVREELAKPLCARLEAAYRRLEEFDYD